MFEHRSDFDVCPRAYLLDPKMIKTMADIEYHDKSTLHSIERFRDAIKQLEEYRMLLYERVKVLQTATYKRRLKLERDPNWSGKKYYNVRIVKDYGGDIGEIKELAERYPGTERHKAIKRFEELKKQYPGIETVKDIERRNWER